MKYQHKKSGSSWLWLSAIVIIIDQLSKYWTVQSLALGESYEVLSFFHFTYAQNYGAAFSFLGNAGGWQRYFFTSIALIVSVYIVYLLQHNSEDKYWSNMAFSLILAGALGNVIDRIIFGYVIDFLDFNLGFYHWPIFNVADSSICIGVVMFILDPFFAVDGEKDPH
ncbi:MAG: signal peptidase II [Psychromonas sp.]|nr:signal peptidase II [Psychromonas sp.]